MNKTILSIKGMHCRSCEILIEDRLKKIGSILKVKASNKKGQVAIISQGSLDIVAVKNALEELGYSLGTNEIPLITNNKEEYKLLITATLFLAAVYFFARAFNFDSLLRPAGTNGASYPVVFTIGITAGFSTCMALIGGLILGVSTRFAEKHPEATSAQKFKPHVFFNLGRIASYFVLGGLIGSLGSLFKLPTSALGILSIIVGIYMLFLGLQIIEIFPRISSLPMLPKSLNKLFKISEKSNQEYSHKNAAVMGALTFFLPCGFTQAMQLYAMSTGNFYSGAMIMGIFALGTTPGLLGIGGLVSYINKGYFSRLFFKFVGILVIVLSFFNITTGANIAGINIPSLGGKTDKQEETKPTGDIRVLKGTYTAEDGRIKPDKFKVAVGQSVRLEVFAQDDGEGCMGSIMIPGLDNEPQFFEKGKTATFEFIPKKKGTYRITCAMGVPSGIITVE